jgi:hypothetical protein
LTEADKILSFVKNIEFIDTKISPRYTDPHNASYSDVKKTIALKLPNGTKKISLYSTMSGIGFAPGESENGYFYKQSEKILIAPRDIECFMDIEKVFIDAIIKYAKLRNDSEIKVIDKEYPMPFPECRKKLLKDSGFKYIGKELDDNWWIAHDVYKISLGEQNEQ